DARFPAPPPRERGCRSRVRVSGLLPGPPALRGPCVTGATVRSERRAESFPLVERESRSRSRAERTRVAPLRKVRGGSLPESLAAPRRSARDRLRSPLAGPPGFARARLAARFAGGPLRALRACGVPAPAGRRVT